MNSLTKTITLLSKLIKCFTFFAAIILCLILSQKSSKAQCINDSSNSEELKILSWNIYMLPHFWIHTGQIKRAHDIARALKDEKADVIVFEEAFDNKSRQIIWEGLKSSFPFQSGDPAKNVSWKTSNGVWIISKTPITVVKKIFFNEAAGSDAFACKGAILIEAEKNNMCYQLIGTHLQANLKNRDVSKIRSTQYDQIQKELLEACKKKDVPQLVVGDFNTIKDDTINFYHMLDVMKVNECPINGERCYSYDYSDNDFIMGQNCQPQLIDYVLFRSDGVRKVTGQTQVKIFRNKWDVHHEDLSDHFAISAEINLR